MRDANRLRQKRVYLIERGGECFAINLPPSQILQENNQKLLVFGGKAQRSIRVSRNHITLALIQLSRKKECNAHWIVLVTRFCHIHPIAPTMIASAIVNPTSAIDVSNQKGSG